MPACFVGRHGDMRLCYSLVSIRRPYAVTASQSFPPVFFRIPSATVTREAFEGSRYLNLFMDMLPSDGTSSKHSLLIPNEDPHNPLLFLNISWDHRDAHLVAGGGWHWLLSLLFHTHLEVQGNHNPLE